MRSETVGRCFSPYEVADFSFILLHEVKWSREQQAAGHHRGRWCVWHRVSHSLTQFPDPQKLSFLKLSSIWRRLFSANCFVFRPQAKKKTLINFTLNFWICFTIYNYSHQKSSRSIGRPQLWIPFMTEALECIFCICSPDHLQAVPAASSNKQHFLPQDETRGGGESDHNSKRLCSETESEELQSRRLAARLQQGGLNERDSGNVSFVSYTISWSGSTFSL